MDALFDQITINLDVIKRQPKHEIFKRENILSIEKIRTASKKNFDWFSKNCRYSNNIRHGIEISPKNF